MKDIEKQIEELKELHKDLCNLDFYDKKVKMDKVCKSPRIVTNAIDTIQELSAKLSAKNMNDGWHVVEDGNLPKCTMRVIITCYSKEDGMFTQEACFEECLEDTTRSYFDALLNYDKVIAWMPLPEPYRKER